jgi:hypothetical protein
MIAGVIAASAIALGAFIWYAQIYAPAPVETPAPVAPP